MIKTGKTSVSKTRNHLKDQISANPATWYGALFLVTGLALAIRVFRISAWSFWIDEIYEIGYARDAMQTFFLTNRISLLLIGNALQTMGVSEFSARFAPATIGVLSIPVVYLLVEKFFGRPVALLSAFFLAISHWHLYWSQNARFYTLLLLFYTISAFLFYWWLEKDRFIYLVLAGLFLVLAVRERLMAGFMVPVVGAYILALLIFPFEKPEGLNRRNLLILLTPVVLFGFYQVYLAAFGDGGQTPIYADFVERFIGHQRNPIRVLLAVVYDVTVPVFVLALGGGGYLVWKRSRAGLFFLLGALVPLALMVLISPFTQTFSRYVFMTLPAYIILAAVAVWQLYRRMEGPARLLAVAVLLVVLVDSMSQMALYYEYQNGNRLDWKGAFQVVQEQRKPDDWVVTTRTPIGDYYLGEEVAWTQGLDPSEVIESGRTVWFVIDNRTGFVSPKLQEFLDQDARLVAIRDFYIPGKLMMMRVYKYVPSGGG